MYITINPINIKDNAKDRILFILLEYLAIFLPPRQTIPQLFSKKKYKECRKMSFAKEGN